MLKLTSMNKCCRSIAVHCSYSHLMLTVSDFWETLLGPTLY